MPPPSARTPTHIPTHTPTPTAPSAPLDRLSALLSGLSPRVWLSADSAELGLHIVRPAAEPEGARGLRLMVTPRGQKLAVGALHRRGLALWLSFQVALDGPVGPLFQEQFRDPLDIALDQADAALGQITQLIAGEVQAPRCGHPLLMNRAGDILLIGLLRHLVASPQGSMHLFNGLADPRMARALVAMHTHPGFPWSVAALAQEAGMSRTSFAQHFRAVVGMAPVGYLAKLRLALAQKRVQDGVGLKQAARETGYAGPSTLSRALHRAQAHSQAFT